MGKFYWGSYSTPFIVCGDDGHGLETLGKRSPSGIRENEFNSPTKYYMFEALKRCGIASYDVSPDRTDNSLQDRTNSANSLVKKEADKKRIVYASIHYDALSDTWANAFGHTIYVYPGSDHRFANCIHKYLIQGTKQFDRGIKEEDFHVLRETVMPAILSENGFMSDKWEASLMRDPKFQKEVGEEHTKGICEYFGVKYVPETSSKTVTTFKVQVGAFTEKERAEALQKELQAKGYPAIIV